MLRLPRRRSEICPWIRTAGRRAPIPPTAALRIFPLCGRTPSSSCAPRDFDAASPDLEKLTAETGGYIESSSLSGDKGSRSAYYTLRIPQEKFETFYAQLGDRAHVVYSSRSSEDITEQYTDIETRLATLQTKHERLLALLDQAGKMEDIISLENALADCEYEIDSLTGSKRHYDDLVGFSTFYVDLEEVQTLTKQS